jgi:beta-glucosidase
VLAEVFDEGGRLLDTRELTTADTVVGFDDDLAARPARVRVTGRSVLSGTVEVGVIGRGDWAIRVGDETDPRASFAVREQEGGIGSSMLSPPTASAVLELAEDDLVTVELTLTASGEPGAMGWVTNLGLTLRPVPEPAETVIARAAEAAAGSDVAVVVVGTTEEQETEAVDKSSIALFGEQDALVSAVAAAAHRTVVVINAATPVLMPWADEVDAILVAGLPGQEAGHAVAAALLGGIEPAGRLVTSYPAADGAAPAWQVVPTDGVLRYDEGTAIGYRGHWAGKAPAPAFWFGHGLGYGSWDYTDAEVAWDGDEPSVRVTVTNVGERTSREVVQVYFDPAEADEPIRLVGWTAVIVDARNGLRVEVDLDRRLWRRWDESAGGWGTPLGAGELLVARGLGDIRARLTLR